jgi:hypothetical protein
MRHQLISSTLALALALFQQAAHSGVIDPNDSWIWTGPVGGGVYTIPSTPNPNNDNASLSANEAFFLRSFTAVGFIDTSILVNNSNGVILNEYRISAFNSR